MSKSIVDIPPGKALRPPIWLYRLQLGWLLGERLLLLMHTGQSSGLLQQAVIGSLGTPRIRLRISLLAVEAKNQTGIRISAKPRRSLSR
jgi:hypothetical protein